MRRTIDCRTEAIEGKIAQYFCYTIISNYRDWEVVANYDSGIITVRARLSITTLHEYHLESLFNDMAEGQAKAKVWRETPPKIEDFLKGGKEYNEIERLNNDNRKI